MDLKQLEYFVRVAELGSFTRASIVLDVAQPALSRQIRSLEVELRQNLLIRNGRGVTLTEAGKVLLEHSRGILHQVERAKEELGRVRSALAGRVALGLPPSLSRVLTLPLTRIFRERMPEAALCIREGLSTTMTESLQSGRLDIALLHNAAPSPDIETQPLMDEALFVVTQDQGALTHPHTLAELATLPLIIPSRPNAIRMLVETEMARAGLRPRIELEIDAVSAILDLVAEGAGVAVLGHHAIHTSNRPLLLQAHPLTPALYSQLSIAVSAQRPATLTQQAVIGLIRELVGSTESL
jgi:LysR family nitrogen assimilation transcriptional regulator